MRQPEAPIGCPSAIAPPLTLTFFVAHPMCRFTAIACAAKASLISIKSRSFGSQPARDRQRLEAGTGPIPMYFGSTPAEAKALMRAMGFNPNSFAFFDEARTTAAAPSRSEEHTSELQSLTNLVCRLLLEKKKKHKNIQTDHRTTTR